MEREIDQLLRVLILEGVAGVQEGSWSRGQTPAVGLSKARQTLPGVAARWFALEPQGLLLNLRKGMGRAFPSACSEDRADVEMSLIGLGSNVFYQMGRSLQSNPDLITAVQYIGRHGFHRMTDHRIRTNTRKQYADVGFDVAMPEDLDAPIPNSKEAITFLREQVADMYASAPGKLKILNTMLDHPEWTRMQLAEHLGMVAPCEEKGYYGSTYVARVIREFIEVMGRCAPHLQTPRMWADEVELARDNWNWQHGMAA